MPKSRKLRFAALTASLCISIALSIVISEISLPNTSTTTVQCNGNLQGKNMTSTVTRTSNGDFSTACLASVKSSFIVAAISLLQGPALNSVTDGIVIVERPLGFVLLLRPVRHLAAAHRAGRGMDLPLVLPNASLVDDLGAVFGVSTGVSWVVFENVKNFVMWTLGKCLIRHTPYATRKSRLFKRDERA